MYPQTFLKTFWRLEFRPQIFVAMSFADRYKSRFEKIIAPAIRSIRVDGVNLEPYRVDLSKSGDSILTDIMDGIAHSQIVLADVSSTGKDSVTGDTYRNGNVMYEVGIALACRHSAEVLLVRDDTDRFLFDVSTVPHKFVDFTDTDSATVVLKEELEARLKERNHINDARVRLSIAGLSREEVAALRRIADLPHGAVWGRKDECIVDYFEVASISRLLDKQLIMLAGQLQNGYPAYKPTPLGRVVAQLIKSDLPKF
jgi:hypothetical protein